MYKGEAFVFSLVAPYTGAWIEIAGVTSSIAGLGGRTLHGCVD